MKPRRSPRAQNRPPHRASAGAFALFYCSVALSVGLLGYAGVFLSGPATRPPVAADDTMRIAKIQLDQGDGKGQCRQVIFDNASGHFEDAGMSRCRNLIPEELVIDTVRSRSGHADAFTRSFRR